MPDMEPDQAEGTYIPGTCNIGKEEINKRRRGAYSALAVTVICVIALQLTHAPQGWRLLLFIPLSSTILSFMQAYMKFCVGFGIKGAFNFGVTGKLIKIVKDEYLQKDRAKARKMILSSAAIGLLLAVVYYLLPV